MASTTHDGYVVESSGTDEELAAEIQPQTGSGSTLQEEGKTSAVADTAAAEAKPAAKPRNDPQARVQDATAKEATAKRERDEARAETARLKARLDELEKPKPVAEKPVEKVADWKRFRALPDAPKLADFDGTEALEDWTAAMGLFVADKRYEENRRVETQTAEKTRAEASEMEHYTAFQKKLKTAAEDDPGFIDRIDPRLTETPRLSMLPPGQTPTMGNWLVEQIYRSEPVKELLVHFSDEKEVQRLVTLQRTSGIEASMREFARIEARLTPAAAPLRSGTASEVKESKAKPPIRPERGSSQVGNDEPPGDDASDAEHEAYWGPRRAKLRRA